MPDFSTILQINDRHEINEKLGRKTASMIRVSYGMSKHHVSQQCSLWSGEQHDSICRSWHQAQSESMRPYFAGLGLPGFVARSRYDTRSSSRKSCNISLNVNDMEAQENKRRMTVSYFIS